LDESFERPQVKQKPMTEKERILAYLQHYLTEEPRGNIDELEINDDFWLQPHIVYWPSVKLMKELITIAASTKSIMDLIF
jgi:hypothetical protein